MTLRSEIIFNRKGSRCSCGAIVSVFFVVLSFINALLSSSSSSSSFSVTSDDFVSFLKTENLSETHLTLP